MTISNWKKEGLPHEKNELGITVFSWFACHDWWLANKYQGTDRRSDRPPAKYESEAKLFDVKAERERLRLEVDRKNLVHVAAIESAWTRAATIVKDRVLGIPAALKLQIPNLTTEDIAKAREICRGVLEAIAECPTSPTQTPADQPLTD